MQRETQKIEAESRTKYNTFCNTTNQDIRKGANENIMGQNDELNHLEWQNA